MTRDELLVDVASRLRPVCATMPAAAFDALVTQIVDTKLKHDALAQAEVARIARQSRPRP